MNPVIEFILIGLINCLVIIGFHLAVQFEYNPKDKHGEYIGLKQWTVKSETKNILWFVKYYCEKDYGNFRLPLWIRKPLFDCPRCMASIHSTYVYFLFGQPLIYYPVYILMLSGMIEIVTRKFEI